MAPALVAAAEPLMVGSAVVLRRLGRADDAWPRELHIARALFIEPIDREPQAHVYYDTHAAWARVADDLPPKPDRPRQTLRKSGSRRRTRRQRDRAYSRCLVQEK